LFKRLLEASDPLKGGHSLVNTWLIAFQGKISKDKLYSEVRAVKIPHLLSEPKFYLEEPRWMPGSNNKKITAYDNFTSTEF
jgi:hypothetical protein